MEEKTVGYRRAYSKDPKIMRSTIEEFMQLSDYLVCAEGHLWSNRERPMLDEDGYAIYYKLTSDKLISIFYGMKVINYGTSYVENLERVRVAIRDGVKEYDILNRHLAELYEYKAQHKRDKKVDKEIEKYEEAMKLLPEYRGTLEITKPIRFEDCLVETGYQTEIEALKGRYLVLDVETNGLRKANDDLLSISIYDPTTGICYNRLLPLDLQPLVLTGWIHGIDDDQLSYMPHLTQTEVDQIVEYFHLKDRILLSYSGGKGTFDSSFLINYCKRHNLSGFEELQYDNIKSYAPSATYGSAGEMTKDNLCKILGIEGVQQLHSAQNDCVLEWKLFEKIKDEGLFCIDDDIYRYYNGYIIPISYLNRNIRLADIAGIEIPHITAHCTEIYKYVFPKKVMQKIQKFPNNITGVTLEHGINEALNVVKQDNIAFLAENKKKVEFVASLRSHVEEIPVVMEPGGLVTALNSKYDAYVAKINKVTALIIESMKDVFDYVKNVIFHGEEIMSQELCISDDGKVLALCDLSSPSSIMEIKTCRMLMDCCGDIQESFARQLFYESRGRDVYLLSCNIGWRSAEVTIYNVSLNTENEE